MLFIYLIFLLMVVSIVLFYLVYKRLHFKYSNSKHIAPDAGVTSGGKSVCIPPSGTTLTICNTTTDCKNRCTDANSDKLVCRPYLNAAKQCATMENCDATFCNLVYDKDQNTRVCKPKSFCQSPEPIEVCNERNGGEFQLTGVGEGGGVAEQVFQCICKYPQIAAGDGCELNPGVCEGGEWIYHAKDDCNEQVTKEMCLYRTQLTPTMAPGIKRLSPTDPLLRKSCNWIETEISGVGTCVSRNPEPTTDCICPPTSYLLIKDQGAIGKQNVPICVPKNKTTCANEKMCTNFYSNVEFPLLPPTPASPGQNYKSTLKPVPYLLPRRSSPSEFVWSPAACFVADNFTEHNVLMVSPANSVTSPTFTRNGGLPAPSSPTSPTMLGQVCSDNIGDCIIRPQSDLGMTSNNFWVANDTPSKPKYANFTGPAGTMGGLPAFKNDVVKDRYNCPTTNTAKGPICNLAYSQSNGGAYHVGSWSTQQTPSEINWQALIGPDGLAKNETTYVNSQKTRTACNLAGSPANSQFLFQTKFTPHWSKPT